MVDICKVIWRNASSMRPSSEVFTTISWKRKGSAIWENVNEFDFSHDEAVEPALVADSCSPFRERISLHVTFHIRHWFHLAASHRHCPFQTSSIIGENPHLSSALRTVSFMAECPALNRQDSVCSPYLPFTSPQLQGNFQQTAAPMRSVTAIRVVSLSIIVDNTWNWSHMKLWPTPHRLCCWKRPRILFQARWNRQYHHVIIYKRATKSDLCRKQLYYLAVSARESNLFTDSHWKHITIPITYQTYYGGVKKQTTSKSNN